MIGNDTLKKINSYLNRQNFVLAGYFFGSYATKTSHTGSDLDIALFIDGKINSYDRFFEVSRGVNEILKKDGISEMVDIRPVFVDKKQMRPQNSSFLFNFEVIKPNKLFYQRNPEKIALMELNILKSYHDFQRLNKIRLNYLTCSINQNDYGYSQH